MKHITLLIIGALALFNACSPDEETVTNIILPEDQTDIFASEVNLIGGSEVLIDWQINDASISQNATYNVIINDIQVAENISRSSLTIDATSFVSDEYANTAVLAVFIETLGTDAVAMNFEFTEVIELNAEPLGLKIDYISAQTAEDGYFVVNFTKAYDLNEDLVTYDFYVNDELISANIKVADEVIYPTDYVYNGYEYIPSDYVVNATSGTIYLPFDVAAIGDEDTTIKIIAKDNEGGTIEAENTFNLNATDQDLGLIDLAYENSISFPTNEDETDNLIRINFEVAAAGTLKVSSLTGVSYSLYDSNETILSNEYFYNDPFTAPIAEAGTYTLAIKNFTNNLNTETLTFLYLDESASDQDLGVISTLPYNETFSVDFENEIDNEIDFTFEITEETGYLIKLDSNYYHGLILLDDEGNVVDNETNNAVWSNNEFLAPGIYTLKVVDGYYSNFTNEPTSNNVTFMFQEPTATNVDLGVISLPFVETFSFDFFIETDQSIEYSFEVTESMGYNITSDDSNLDFIIKDRFGNEIDDAYNNQLRSGNDLLIPGKYILEVIPEYNYYYYDYPDDYEAASFQVYFDTQGNTDEDLGTIATPSSQVFEFDFSKEFDDVINYTFTITEESSFYISTNYANVSLTLRENTSTNYWNYITSSSRGISSEASRRIAAGTYILVLDDNISNTTRGELFIEISQ